jgi:MerR family mercuric resistance operon transcriptional regulator
MDEQTPMLGIGALSKQTGCNIETIRYYEKIHLMHSPARTEGGHRMFNHAQVKRLWFILRCRQLGFSIDEIRNLLGLVDGEGASCAEVKLVTEAHLGAVRQKIHDLKNLEGVLAQMVSECAGTEVPDCPIIDTLYAAA